MTPRGRHVGAAVAAVGADPLSRAPLCAAMVEIAIAAGRLDDAVAAASELEATAATYATSGLEAMAAAARGAVLLAEGQAGSRCCARPVGAGTNWAQRTTPPVCVRLADAYRALGDAVSAAAEVERAKAVFERLGVHPPTWESPAGLTLRECEVLALVADGRSTGRSARRSTSATGQSLAT